MECKLLQKVVNKIDQRYRHNGDLTVVTTIGLRHVDFYVDPQSSKAPNRKVMHLRLEIKREQNGRIIPVGEPLSGDEDIKIYSSISETEVEFKEYQKYFLAAQWGNLAYDSSGKSGMA